MRSYSLLLTIVLCICTLLFSKKINDFSLKKSKLNSPTTEEEYSIYSFFEKQANPKVKTSSALKEKEQLYEAYNLLHTLAQDFHKPFDAPAVIVVGHQTSGKSALIEALMGFQFNQVGGGTKTRRPVALRMQYNPNCVTPLCFLTRDNGKEEQASLADIQSYIETENKRLERDATRSFDPREINIRMEYRYCPNMIVIDTPGMLHPPKGRQMTAQQRALAQASREAEALVLSKIRCQDYIILCVEDTTDWKHATTRNIVMQADPQLTRTVLVTTKLDTKLPQFSEAEDLEDFLKAPLIQSLYSQILGGPFFTSVPSGRVGISKDFGTNDDFVNALRTAEKSDRISATTLLGPIKSRESLQHVGVSRLRTFLENRVEDCYRRNVAKIVPLLQTELRHTESKLNAIDEELRGLSLEHLRQLANDYREKFSKELSNAIQGTVKASPAEWGETIDMESLKSGSFLQQDQVKSEQWQQILENEVGNCQHKLFGGAQYHRAMREFTIAVRHMTSQMITEDEIANAAGMGDRHNGVNFMRAACVIAMEKAQMSFEPMLEALRSRTTHIMKRLYPIVEDMVRKSTSSSSSSNTLVGSHSAPFQHMMRSIYNRFVDKQIDSCLERCRDDLHGMTRFVTWDVEDKGGASTLYRLLPTPKKMVEIYSIAVEKKQKRLLKASSNSIDNENDSNGGSVNVMSHNQDEEENEDDDIQYNNVSNNMIDKKKKNNNKSKNPADKVLEDWNEANDNKNDKKKKKISNRKDQKNNNIDEEDKIITPVSEATTVLTAPTSTSTNLKSIDENDAELTDYFRVMQLTEEMISGTSASRTSALVTSLVHFIISSWRNHFARSTAMKFNCFFLMPFMDEFPTYLRNELDNMYDSGVAEMFDIAETRRALQAKRSELLAECTANSKLQQRFDQIAEQLHSNPNNNSNHIKDNDISIDNDNINDDYESYPSSTSSSSSAENNNQEKDKYDDNYAF